MNDDKLLISLAIAINGGSWHPLTHNTPSGQPWNPIQNDADAFRLMVHFDLFGSPIVCNAAGLADDTHKVSQVRRHIAEAALAAARAALAHHQAPQQGEQHV